MRLAHVIATAALLAAPALAAAGTASDSMQVSLNLQNNCTIAIDDLAFGVRSSLAANIDAQTQMRVRCTGISSQLRVDVDGGGSGDIHARRMTDGNGNSVNYQLYAYPNAVASMTPAHTWIGFGQNLTWTLHGRVFAGQNPKVAGTYSDTLIATVTF